MTQRTSRIDELLRQEISELLRREVQDPRIGFATVTDVETAPDLRHAKVWMSVIGTDAERSASITALQHVMPFIRHQLGGRLRLKRIPELHVREDTSAERGARVLRLLTELEEGADPASVEPVDATLPTPRPRLPQAGDAADVPDVPSDPGVRRPRRRDTGPARGGSGRPPEARRPGRRSGPARNSGGPR